MTETIALSVSELSQIGEARRTASALSERLGFNETVRGRVSIVIAELASNLVKFAKNGMLLMQPLERQGVLGLEILSIDQSPGIANIATCLKDGYSTVGTGGSGLGSIQRQSDLFEIHSSVGAGTAILCQLWAHPHLARQELLRLGAICLPKVGETISGDMWAIHHSLNRAEFFVSDGLGHGAMAAEASQIAVRIFQKSPQREPVELLRQMHSALRHSRGAAIAIASLDLLAQTITFAGVGNIAAVLVSPERSRHLISHNGIVGFEMRKVQTYSYPWTEDAILVMHSDGLESRWQLDRYSGLLSRHPSLIAAVLYRDFKRDRDDVTVLISQQAGF